MKPDVKSPATSASFEIHSSMVLQGPHHVASKSIRSFRPCAFDCASAAANSWLQANAVVARGRLRSTASTSSAARSVFFVDIRLTTANSIQRPSGEKDRNSRTCSRPPPLTYMRRVVPRASVCERTSLAASGAPASRTLHESLLSNTALLSASIAATSASVPLTAILPERQEPTEYRRMSALCGGASGESSRTDQKFTRYGSGCAPSAKGTDNSTALCDVHHAFVFSFWVGTAVAGGPSSSKTPLRLRSIYKRVRSAGWAGSAVAITRTQDRSVGPTLIAPVLASTRELRTASAGNVVFESRAESGTCVPLGLKFGAGPLPGARYARGTRTICSCADGAGEPTPASAAAKATRRSRVVMMGSVDQSPILSIQHSALSTQHFVACGNLNSALLRPSRSV